MSTYKKLLDRTVNTSAPIALNIKVYVALYRYTLNCFVPLYAAHYVLLR